MNPDILLASGFVIYGVSTLTSMAGMSIGAGLLALAMLAGSGGPRGAWSRIRAEHGSYASRLYLRASLLLALACVLSLVAGMLWPVEYGGHGSEIHLLRDSAKLWYLFWPFALAAMARALPEILRWKILRAWLVAFAVFSVLGVIQYYTGFPRAQVIPENPTRFHATLLFGHHLSTASIWIFPAFAALDLATGREGPARIGLPRWFLALATVLGFVTLFLTFSRMAWVATPLALLAWALLRLPRRAAIGAGIAFVLAIGAAAQIPTVRTRITSSLGSSERFALWQANLDFARARPLTGVGWRHNQELSGYYLMQEQKSDHVFSGHAHNVPLDLLGGTGLLGFAAWVAWMVAVMLPLWVERSRGLSPLANGLFCAWIAFLLNGLTQVNFWEGKVEHQMAWAVAWTLAAFPIGGRGRPQVASGAQARDGA